MNAVSSPNSYIENSSPNVTVYGNGKFGKNEIIRVEFS
jgi:hypothetical protein